QALGINKQETAASVGCSHNTVAEVLRRAKEKGLKYPLPEEMTDTKLAEALYPSASVKPTWLLYSLTETDSRDLLEIVETRYKKASTIFCSQFDIPGWREKIGDPILADAICDRIVHDSPPRLYYTAKRRRTKMCGFVLFKKAGQEPLSALVRYAFCLYYALNLVFPNYFLIWL
ncbi:MAG: ATP-binding protein, partial [Clostridia bacterium]|nr:ATP-binding protein [Clostridia bacterium]